MNWAGVLNALQRVVHWVGENPVAVWGAVLSTGLAIREVWRARTGIHLRVDEYRKFNQAGTVVLVTEDVSSGGESMVVVDVYNRGRGPIHLEQVGLHVKTGGWLMFNQAEGMEQLPKKLEPSDGFTMASSSEKVAGVLKKDGRGSDNIYGPFCKDGAGRIYKRRLKKKERTALKRAFGETPAKTAIKA